MQSAAVHWQEQSLGSEGFRVARQRRLEYHDCELIQSRICNHHWDHQGWYRWDLQCQLGCQEEPDIGFGFDQLHVTIDVFCAFHTKFQLLLKLFDMASRWFTICQGESGPGFKRSIGSSNKRLQGSLNCTHKSTIEKIILSLPWDKRMIDFYITIDSDFWRR